MSANIWNAAPLAAALAAWSAPPAQAAAQPEVTYLPIVGGAEVEGALPTAIIGACSATLLSSRLLVTAAHCLADAPAEARVAGVLAPVPIARCEPHPAYMITSGHDLAFCTLAREVSIEPARVISRCEAEQLRQGSQLDLVGYGYLDAEQGGERLERMVSVRVRELREEEGELVVGDEGHGACRGDSGGSAFSARASESPRLLGVISRRGPSAHSASPPDCGSTTIVTAIVPHLAWLEQASGVELETECSGDEEQAPPSGCAMTHGPCGNTAIAGLCALLWISRRRSPRARGELSS